jgi:hypothetical protein
MKRRLLLISIGLWVSTLLFVPKSSTDGSRNEPEFVYARIRYHMTLDGLRMRELPWHHDYPYSDEMFPSVLAEVTNIKSNSSASNIVDIDSTEIFKYPFAYLSEPGFINLNPKDAINLREWLDRGGFLLVDDFRTSDYSNYTGGFEDDIGHFRLEMKKMYPDQEFVRLDLSDSIFNTFYKIDSLEMRAPYIFPGQRPVEFLGLRDRKGNLMMVLNNNNDISEFWEWLDRGEMSMRDATTSFHFGINYVLYAMTH